VTELLVCCVLCACMPHYVDLIHLLDMLWNCLGTQVLCTLVNKRTNTILGQLNSMMKMAWCLPKSESNTI
jgi:hypothetical protein